MHHFNISRINTDFGIFRLSGIWQGESIDTSSVDVTMIEIMGTDGWVLLHQLNDMTIKLINDLTPTIHAHLTAQNG
ncbi:hypothetical protein [Shewanella sp. OMA3-2]|uniref:hypothetical protein n=1 Tax=Shewanella sp. OMA3-2 TaxID=2908650 RepID=UPI001F1765F7|nr:hypothetical protein [Shewanella sp. OMA3-2]UJF22911.1 hypothetical protein L0B17_05910 [Shewanella sp. OMA3-2]